MVIKHISDAQAEKLHRDYLHFAPLRLAFNRMEERALKKANQAIEYIVISSDSEDESGEGTTTKTPAETFHEQSPIDQKDESVAESKLNNSISFVSSYTSSSSLLSLTSCVSDEESDISDKCDSSSVDIEKPQHIQFFPNRNVKLFIFFIQTCFIFDKTLSNLERSHKYACFEE
jgi:hypothetical protein